MKTDVRFCAFMSYCHRDERWAVALQKFLERFRVPSQLASEFDDPRPLRPIFRDQTELTSGELGTVIESGLKASDALIVICSPEATRSRWVDSEIRRYKQLHGDARIFPLIVEGLPHSADPETECFPRALLHTVDKSGELTSTPVEPLAANVGDSGGRRDAFLRIAAALLGVGFDDLKQREQQRRQRQTVVVAAGALTVAAVTSTLAVVAYFAKNEAEFSRNQADDLIGFMVGDLRSRLEPIGRVDVLDAVGDKAMEYFSSLPAGADAAVMDKRAMTLRQIGEVRVSQGRYDEGLAAFREAMAIYERLTANSDPDPDRMYNLAHTHFWIADAHFRRLDYESAEQEIIAYRDTARWLAENYPDNNDYLLELAQAESNLGTLHYRRSQFVDARQRFISAEAAARQIIASEPGNETYISTLAATVSWLGSAEIALGNLEKGTALHREMIDIGRQTVASSDDIRERQFLAVDMQVLSADLHRMGLLDEALSVDAEAVDILGELVEFDPENRNWATSLARGQSIMARHRLTACRLNGVTELLDESQRTLEQQIAVDPSDADTRVDLANVGVERARLAAIQKEIGESRDLATRSRSTLLDVFRDRSDDVMARRDVVRATSALVQVYTIAGDHGQAAEVAASMIDELSGLNLEDADALAWLANIRETGGEEIQAQGLTSYRHPALMPECGQNDGTDSGH